MKLKLAKSGTSGLMSNLFKRSITRDVAKWRDENEDAGPKQLMEKPESNLNAGKVFAS